eukprot:1116705_1
MKPYSGKQIDQYGHRLIPISNTKKDKISSISSSSVNKNRMKPIGGGYGNDNNDPIPSHLRAYYAIQKDLNKLKNGTKKKQNRIQLDAINTKLHSLFFANERTNIANLSAFQKFFLDRMSVQSVHKDLDWHICLLRPKIHSKFHNAQIDEIINMVADLLRKCVKKFNNKRGHLTSAANTSRIGVGTYGRGKDKSHIQSAFILSKPSSSVPPEFYQQQGGRGASQSVVTPLSTNAAFQLKKRTPQHVYTPSGSGGSLHNILSMSSNNYNQELIPAAYNTDQDSYGSPSPHSQCFSDSGDKPAILNHYDVMTPPASVQMKQEIKKNKKEKQKEKHRRLLSFSSRLRIKKKKKKQQNKMSRPNMSMQEVIALTGLPATKKAKGSDHHNVDEPYPMELFHISDMAFVVVYYVKFLTKFEKLMCELLALYQEYARLSDDMASDVALQLSLVASNPRETYTESMVKAQNTMQWGRQSREHPWIRVQTDKRKSRKFGQDLIYMVKYMKSNDIDALHELMKQAPDLNTPDRETGRTVLQIALDKSCKQPSFAFVARYLALKQLLFQQKLVDESIIMQALKTHNPMVAEILLHLDPTLSKHDAEDRSALDLALNANYRNLARYMIKLNVPPWHTQQLMRRWSSACSMGDVVKLRSVLQRGFNIDFFQNDTQKTALIICTQEEYIDCVEFLLKNGCNVNAADVEQKTALHYAAQSLNGELFRMILESKANWTLRDLNTKTAIDYVMSNIGFVPRPKASKSTKQADNSSLQTPTNTRFRAGSGANQDSPTNTFQDNTPQSEERADDMYNKKTKFWRPSGFTLKIDADDDDDNWNQFGYLVQVQGDDDDDDDDDDNTLYNEYIAQLWLYQLDTEKIGVIARDDYIKYIEDEEWQFHNKNDDAHVDFGEFSSLFFDSLYYKSWRHSMQQLADDEDLINGIYEAISDIDASDIAALSLSTEAHEFNAAILSYVNTHVLSDEHDATQSLLYSFPNIYYAKDLIDITSRRRLRKNPHYGSIYGGFGDMKFCFGETGVVDMRTADGDYDKKQLKDVRVGQYVFDGDEYSKVIAVEIGETHMMMLKLSMHHMNDSNQNTDIVLTEDHLIYTRNNKLIRADEVHIGDTLYNDYIVYDIAHNVASKASTPITMSGRIQVNGVKSSCYIAGAREAEIEHQILAPFRWTSQHLSEHYAALVVENCIHDVIQIYVLLIKRYDLFVVFDCIAYHPLCKASIIGFGLMVIAIKYMLMWSASFIF